ncbi:MAG: hypothetical protein CL398_07020 [Acidiferrobacteraceae bacterium]|nr:hypothetical protein [Acidiferrobacteraceae bacterium]
MDHQDLICIDMGGTSFDVSLIRDGEVELKSEFDLQGLPILAPSVELVSIALGGGSIIQELSGGLRVGPESAGSVPGPACYGNGGKVATITDANAVLGRLPPEQRLAGTLQLDLKAANRALSSVGKLLNLDVASAAEQALEVAHFMMAEAIRELTVERGLDPRDFTICAFGGAGPLHAAFVADELNIDRIIIPSGAGSFSAWGMLQGDLRHDMSVTYYRQFNDAQSDLSIVLESLRERVLERVREDTDDLSLLRYEASGEMRYVGQEYSLLVPIMNDRADDELLASFHDAYFQRYGHAQRSAPVEFVSLRIAGIVSFANTDEYISELPTKPAASIASTQATIGGETSAVPIYSRDSISAKISGPSIIVEDSTTILLPKSWTVMPIGNAHLLMERSEQ